MKIFKMILSFLLILLLLGGCSRPEAKEPVTEPEKQQEPVENRKIYSYFAGQLGDTVYTTNYRGSRLDSTAHQKLYAAEKGELGSLLVTEKYLYLSDESQNLVRMGHDGSEPIILAQHLYTFLYMDGWLYYSNNQGLCRLKDGEAASELLQAKVTLEDADSGYLYYNRDYYNDFYRCKTDGSGEEKVRMPQSCQHRAVQDGWIYYYMDPWDEAKGARQYSLRRVRPDGSEDTLLDDQAEGVGMFVVRDSWLYYGNLEKRLHVETGEEQLLMPPALTFFAAHNWMTLGDVVGDHLYVELQIDDANWYDLVRVPLSSIGDDPASHAQHLEEGQWVDLTAERYEQWVEVFYAAD